MSHRSTHPFLGPRIAALAFLVLTAAFGVNFAAGQFFGPLRDAHGWDLGVTSAAAAVTTAASGIAQPVLGRLIDRCGPRVVIPSSLALMAAGQLVMTVATERWHLVFVSGILNGVGFAGSSSLAVTVLLSRWYDRRRAEVFPRVFLGINAGQLTLVPVAALLIEHLGFRAAYLALGLVVLLVVVPLTAMLLVDAPEGVGQHPDGAREPSGPAATPAWTIAQALHAPAFWAAALAFGANGWTLYFVLLHLPRLAADTGGGVAAGGGLLALAAAGSAASMLVLPALVRRTGPRRLAAWLLALRSAVLLGTGALAATPGDLRVAAVLFGVVAFPVIPLVMALITQRFGTDVLGGALGVVFVTHQLFAAAGVAAGGLLRELTGSYDAALALGAGVALTGAGLLLALRDLPDLVPADRTINHQLLRGGTP